MLRLWEAIGCFFITASTVRAGIAAKLSTRAISNAQMTWICPGTQFDNAVVEFIQVYGTVWANGTLNPQFATGTFNIDNNGVLMSNNKKLCFNASTSTSYVMEDKDWWQEKVRCPDTDHFTLYRGAYLSWGGGYDMFCLGCSDQDCEAGDGLLAWVPGIPAYEQGNSPCRYRGRISLNGYSVQPAPATPIQPTITPSQPGSTTAGPTTTMPITTTMTPTTTQAPPPPGNTKTPNPTVTSAVKSVSSKIQSVSSVVSSYLNNPSSSPLAQAAEDSTEAGIVYVYEAEAIANSFSISSVAAKLDDTAQQLFKLAVAAIIARQALTAEAAASVAAALGPVADLIAAAGAAAADPVQNPSPTSQRPTTTKATTTTSSYVCTINIAQNDATLAQPSSTDEPTKRGLQIRENIARAANSVQAAGSGRGKFCGVSYNVPPYNSYSSAGGNSYTYYYNYYTSNQCGIWDFNLLSGTSPSTFVTPRGYQIPDGSGYATEHIYEIQTIAIFLDYAWQNEPYLKTLYTSEDQFCNGANSLGVLLRSTGTFSGYQPYDYSTAPIAQFFGQLESSASEFVYLETKLNNVKGVLFGARNPSTESVYERALPVASRITLVSEYLNQARIASIYKTVSSRIRQSVYTFGQACNASTDARYHQFGNISWTGLYDQWENSYLNGITNRMRAAALANSDAAIANINLYIRDQGAAFQQREDYTRLEAHVLDIESVQGPIAAINLNALKRS